MKKILLAPLAALALLAASCNFLDLNSDIAFGYFEIPVVGSDYLYAYFTASVSLDNFEGKASVVASKYDPASVYGSTDAEYVEVSLPAYQALVGYCFVIDGLEPETQYCVRARIGNDSGVNEWSDAFTIVTLAKYEPNAVDLGLSVLWADCNIGASKMCAYGSYYSWGEKELQFMNSAVTYSGESYEDTATAVWGDGWRLPTKAEAEELLACPTSFVQQDGVNCLKVTGNNGNALYLPAAGYRVDGTFFEKSSMAYFWTSTPSDTDTAKSAVLYIEADECSVTELYRYFGASVRPVRDR